MNDSHTQPVAVEHVDQIAMYALDDALGFLTEVERPIVLQALAAHRLAERARLTTDRSLGAWNDTLDWDGTEQAAQSAYEDLTTPPVPANSEQVPMTFNDASSQDRRLAGLVALFRQLPGATLFRIHHPEQAAADIFERLLSVPANSGEGEKLREAAACRVRMHIEGKMPLRRIYGDPHSGWHADILALATPDAAPIGSVDADYSGYVEEGDAQ